MAWDLPSAHVVTVTVTGGDIDAYRHVNNAVYVTWCDQAAWDHSAVLGLPIERCLELDRGMAVLRSVIVYSRPAVLGDQVQIATWLLPDASKLKIRRRFQMRRLDEPETLVRAEVEYVCIELSSGRPSRWPPDFRDRYVARDDVMAMLPMLAAL